MHELSRAWLRAVRDIRCFALFAVCLIVGSLPLLAATGNAVARHADFVVRDLKTGKVTLSGHLTEQIADNRESRDIVYLDAAGKVVQTEHAVFETTKLRVLDYVLHNAVLGYEAAFTGNLATLDARYREGTAEPFHERRVDWGPNDYHPSVFEALILRNLETLYKSQPLDFDLLIPQEGAGVGMEFVYEGERALDADRIAVFRLQPRFGLLRMIMPRTEYGFSLGPRPALRQYIGPGPFPNSHDEVDIRYSAPK